MLLLCLVYPTLHCTWVNINFSALKALCECLSHGYVLCFRLTTLSSMSASDELDDSQVRQMLFDLESAYNAFNRFLHSS